MSNIQRGASWLPIAVLTLASLMASAETKKQFHYTLGPHPNVNVFNQFGPVTVKPSDGTQVDVTATLHSDKVEVDATQRGNRLELRTHFLQKADSDQGKVDYEIHVPADTAISIRSATGTISVADLHADLLIEGDAAKIDVKRITDAHVRARSLNGPVNLEDIHNGHVEITSVSGPVTLNKVDGSLVTASTTSGKIVYRGDFSGGGDYAFTNHSGDIEVTLPAEASVDISAVSVSGAVDNDFPFQPTPHTPFPITQGKSLVGTSNSGSSSVRLRSFSGKIRVKKQ